MKQSILTKILNRPECILNKQFINQLLATLAVNLIMISHGISIGWLSPTLSLLQSPDSPLNFPVDISSASWIGSLVGLGSMTGNVLFGSLQDVIGRKTCLYIIAIPHAAFWLLVFFATSVEYLYVGRFLGGMAGGGAYCVVAIFVSEIADTRIRGTLSSTLILSVNSGVLIGLILSSHLPYHLIPLAVISLPIMYFIGALFLPETPVYLLRRGKVIEGEKSFKFYKNCANNSALSELKKCSDEFDELKSNIDKSQIKGKLTLNDFVNRDAFKAFSIAMALLFVNQFCGAFSFLSYMTRIFDASGSIIDSNSSSIITGAVQIVGSYTATYFVDRYGRKILMLISTAGMFISLSLTGLYTYFASTVPALTEHNWIPLVLMQCYIFVANIGVVVLTIVVLIEITPTRLRSIGTSFFMVVMSALVFAMLKIFPIFLHTFGISITMWACAAVSLFGFVIFLFFLEETKGKSLTADK